jgi:hypothetical protein
MDGFSRSRDISEGEQDQKPPLSRFVQGQVILKSLLTLALVWVIVNLSSVYLAKHGAKAYRVESAFFIFCFVVLLKLVSLKTNSQGEDAFD